MPRKSPAIVVGWREWVALPRLGLTSIKAKIDTGARTSSLHAYDVREFERRGVKMVRFRVHPDQRDSDRVVECEAPLVDRRKVRPSTGHAQLRPVILTTIDLMGEQWELELTLTRRDEMGFRMLLGRQALRNRFVVDPGASFRNGKKPSGKKKKTDERHPRGRKGVPQ